MLDLCNSGQQLSQELCEFGNILSLHGTSRFSPRQIVSNHSCFMGSVSIFHYSFVTRAKAASFALALCNGALQHIVKSPFHRQSAGSVAS